VPVVLALGTNLGDRAAVLRSAVQSLAGTPGLVVERVSPVVETDPVGGPEQGPYLNAVVLARTTSSPSELLSSCQRIEARHGRQRLVRWGARTLDIDIVSYDDLVCATTDLTLPHPRAHLRGFVLVPWCAVDPGAVLPGPHGGAVRDLAEHAADAGGVRPHPAVRLDPGDSS
jgi:2-amino-4-hydroxy-6-hydroxymethyldihydropteridine diphosphokinase